MMNANEQEGKTVNGASKIIRECKLVDLIAKTHGDKTPETCVRGTKTIDCIFMSPDIADMIAICGMLQCYDGIMSDHRGWCMDTDSGLLFGGGTEDVTSPSNRILTPTSKKKTESCIQLLWKCLNDHNIPERTKRLQEASKSGNFSAHHTDEHNKIDRDLGRGMQHAEQQCGEKQHGCAFSPMLEKAGLTVRHWQTKRSGVKNK